MVKEKKVKELSKVFSPLASPLFQSQVGHSLMWEVGTHLSPKVNCRHYDVTSVSFCMGAK